VLFLKGLLSPSFHVESAVKRSSADAVITNSYVYVGGVFGWALDTFPYDYDELMGFDLVILGDISADCLGQAATEMLKDYCQHGGNLLVLAGPCAYGHGGYQTASMSNLLPVQIETSFDLQKIGKGSKVQAIPELGADGLRPEYIHRVKAKPDADVLASCDSSPMIVLGKFGNGMVCCVTTPPMGTSNFCDQPQWQDVLAYVLREMGLNR
jgi:uncharacterized membrane protein